MSNNFLKEFNLLTDTTTENKILNNLRNYYSI